MTFLMRKIKRLLDRVAIQQRNITRTDDLIDYHYGAIKKLKRKQNRSLSIKKKLNDNISLILLRLTDKEKYNLLRGMK